MRAATFIAPGGSPQPASADPRDVLEHGEAPRHRLAGPVFLQDGCRLTLRGEPGDPVLVRLPRRLSATRLVPGRRSGRQGGARDKIPQLDPNNILQWICGCGPPRQDLLELRAIGLVDAGEDPLAGRSDVERRWALWCPRRGLGVPKPLPRRRRRVSREERSELFQNILNRLGVDCAEALNRSARERLLGARGFVEQAVERAAPGARVTGYEVSNEGAIVVQILAPIKEIQLRMVVSPDVVSVTGGR